jgi:hypothetical protein
VYLVFNTLFGLLSQARQAECFASVARVLDPGGMFVIECFVPDLARFDHDQRVQARSVTEDSAIIEVSVHDRVHQRVTTQMITLDGPGIHLRPVAIRYSYPAELPASLTGSAETSSPTRQMRMFARTRRCINIRLGLLSDQATTWTAEQPTSWRFLDNRASSRRSAWRLSPRPMTSRMPS